MTWRHASCASVGIIRLAQSGTSSSELHVTGLQCSEIEWRASVTAGCPEGSDAPDLSDGASLLQSTKDSRPATTSRKLQLPPEAAANSASSSSSNQAQAQQTLSCTLTWAEGSSASMHHVFYCCDSARVSMTGDWAPWTWLGSSRQRAFRVASLALECATGAVNFAVSASDSNCKWNIQDAAVVTVRPETTSLQ